MVKEKEGLLFYSGTGLVLNVVIAVGLIIGFLFLTRSFIFDGRTAEELEIFKGVVMGSGVLISSFLVWVINRCFQRK